MRNRVRSIFVALTLVVSVLSNAGGAQAAAPFDITLNGPATFYPGQPLSSPFTGSLTVSSLAGVPNQTVELSVDGQLVETAATTAQGNFAFSLQPFSGTTDRTVRVTAFAGTPLETSTEVVVEVVRFLLDLRMQGSGNGIVSSTPVGGISCPPTCSASVPATTEIDLTAVASSGSTFVSWGGSGPCAGPLQPTCRFSLVSDTTLSPTFNLITYSLTVSRSGSGAGTVVSSPAGINCGIDCSEAYVSSTVVNLTAIPSFGSTFAGWSGAGCFGTGSCSVTMNASKAVTATFSVQTFTLSVFKAGAGAGAGSVFSSPFGINCGGDCQEVYTFGQVVTLFANVGFPYSFNGWSGAPCSGTGNCTVTMNSNFNITAFF